MHPWPHKKTLPQTRHMEQYNHSRPNKLFLCMEEYNHDINYMRNTLRLQLLGWCSVKSVYLLSADLMLFTLRSGEFELVIFNKFTLVWSRRFLLQYFTRRISPSAFVNLICLSASWHENSLSELGMGNLIEIMFGSHPSFGTGGHFLSARVMKRLWKKQVSIDQLNIVMQIHFYIYFKVC